MTKLIDLNSLNIPTEAAPQVEAAYKLTYPNDILINTDDLRLRWMKKLVLDPIYQTFQVVCDESGFDFWCRAPEVVEIISFAGKKLTKSKRLTDNDQWYTRIVTGAQTKTQLKNWAKNNRAEQFALSLAWNAAKPIDTDLGDADGDYTLVTEETLEAVVDEICEAVRSGSTLGWDTETEDTGEDDTGAPNPYTAAIVGFSASVRDNTGYYFPINHRHPITDEPLPGNIPKRLALSVLQRILEATPPFDGITHNGKYDFSVVAAPAQGLDINWVYNQLNQTQCTMLLAAVCSEPSAKLKRLAETELNATVIDFKKLTGGRSFAYVPLGPATIYAAQDADWTRRLYPILKQRAIDRRVLHIYEEDELPIQEYFMRLERRGIRINKEKFLVKEAEYLAHIARLEKLFITTAINLGLHVPDDFNINSGAQVAKIFFDQKPMGLGLPVSMRNQDNSPKTDKKHFNRLIAQGIYPTLLRILQKYREAFGVYVRYIEPLLGYMQEDGRVRTTIHQVGAQSGRTSSTKPSTQVLPPSIRESCEPEEGGEFAGLDYSQIELRVMAVNSGETNMLEAFQRWEDIHASTQKLAHLPNRTKAKNFNFGVGYGAMPPTLSETAGITLQEAKIFYDQYWEAYPKLRAYLFDEVIPFTLENEESRTWRGRLRIVPKPQSSFQRLEVERIAMNNPTQGGALDIIKQAMGMMLPLVRQMEQLDIHPFNMVHDELDFERGASCPPEVFRVMMNKVRKIMEAANPWPDQVPMPVDVSYGHNWAECK